MNTEQFYTNMPSHEMRVSELLDNEGHFEKMPEDWHVIITDIKKSTAAVDGGLHQKVNLIATGSIIAALNIAFKHNLRIPFFFGGDGATLVVPEKIREELMISLAEHRSNTLRHFNLDLRLGAIEVKEIYEKGYELKIAKLKLNDIFATPVVFGKGLHYAESIVKQVGFESYEYDDSSSFLDLQGMECRWDKIKPPRSGNEVISLLVEAREGYNQLKVFKAVTEILDDTYGSTEVRRPVSTKKLDLEASANRIYGEMLIKIRKFNVVYLIRNLILTLMGKLYLQFTSSGQDYLKRLVALTDTLVLDGRINTVISGTTAQRIRLLEALDQLEADGKLFYGLHVSYESVMSCYVKNMQDDHIHFVDGAGGGYTQAAKQLKQKIHG